MAAGAGMDDAGAGWSVMNDEWTWSYAADARSTSDVTDRGGWDENERWAVGEALATARNEQRPRFAATAGRSFMVTFENSLDTYFFYGLEEFVREQPDDCGDDEHEQTTLGDGGRR